MLQFVCHYSRGCVSDVVYVATIHPYHHAVCQLYLQANKNILCEKPLTLSLRGTQELLAEARLRQVFFMEVRFMEILVERKQHFL